jgi:hypothetical protein
VTQLFDLDNPPAHPPEGADPLMWRLAYQVHTDHECSPFGWCRAAECRQAPWPCRPARLAELGFATALGARAPWSMLNRSRRFHQ